MAGELSAQIWALHCLIANKSLFPACGHAVIAYDSEVATRAVTPAADVKSCSTLTAVGSTMAQVASFQYNIQWRHVPAHQGDPSNEIADTLATYASHSCFCRDTLPNPVAVWLSQYTLDQVKLLLPAVDGCSASCELAWDPRWRCSYPEVFPPASKSFGQSVTEQEALYFILSWAWRQHEKAGGGPCPFNYKWESYI